VKGWHMHGPRKKALAFCDNPDHVTLGFRVGLGLRLDRVTVHIPYGRMC